MKTAYKNRIYPTAEQTEQLMHDIHNGRYAWNNALGNAKESKWNFNQASKSLTELKRDIDHEWLKQSAATALTQKLRDLQDGFVRFFRKQTKYPKFKSRHDPKQSVRYSDVRLNADMTITIPKCDAIRMKITRDNLTQPKMITISFEGDKWYASFPYDTEAEPHSHPNQIVGIDVGLKDFAITCNEFGESNKHNMPDLTEKEQNKRRYQRVMSRRTKGSNRRKKAKNKVFRAGRHIQDVRKDFQHKLSNQLTRENQAVVMEKLNIKGMTKNHKVARAVQESGWYQFKNMIIYKAKKYGGVVIEVDKWFPSTKLCSHCGTKNDAVIWGMSEWTCPECGTHHDRDINAAKNLVLEGTRQLYPEALGNLRSWSDLPLAQAPA